MSNESSFEGIGAVASGTAGNLRKAHCDEHGEYESECFFDRIWSRCPQCEEADRRKRQEAEEADMRRRERAAVEARFGRAGIPQRFRDRTFATYVAETAGQKRALAFAQEYADGFDEVLSTGRSAVFLGRLGTGKTHLSVGIALQVMQQGRTVLFTSVIRALRRIKETWRTGSAESETDVIKAFSKPDLLILDEVGQQFGSDTEKLLLFDVLNERYEDRRPTLLLTNLTIEDREVGGHVQPGLKSYLGERIMDRLREDGGQFVVFDWDSARGAR